MKNFKTSFSSNRFSECFEWSLLFCFFVFLFFLLLFFFNVPHLFKHKQSWLPYHLWPLAIHIPFALPPPVVPSIHTNSPKKLARYLPLSLLLSICPVMVMFSKLKFLTPMEFQLPFSDSAYK